MQHTSVQQPAATEQHQKRGLSLVARLSWQFCLLFLLVMVLFSALILWGLWERTYLQEYRSFQYRANKIYENISWDITIDGFAPTDDAILDYQAIGPDTSLLIADGKVIVTALGCLPRRMFLSAISFILSRGQVH